eukprot:scaffold1793_cov19-Cyclotella_meneghiniana.AAC.3
MAVVSCRWGIPLGVAAVQTTACQIILLLFPDTPSCVLVDGPPDIQRHNISRAYKLCMPSGWHQLCHMKHIDQTSWSELFILGLEIFGDL